MTRREIDLKQPFESAYFQQYYTNYRNKIDDLFASERRFIDEFAAGGTSFLDIGCALGGMFEILGSMLPGVNYTGVDISPNLIAEANKLHPREKFMVYDGAALPFAARQFKRVISLGTTVHDQNYRQLLAQAWRVADEKLLFDIRLTALPEVCSLDRGYVLDGAGMRYPYVVANVRDLLAWLGGLDDLATVKAYGYWGKSNAETVLPQGYEQICMTCLLLEKKPAGPVSGGGPKLVLELPQELIAGMGAPLVHG